MVFKKSIPRRCHGGRRLWAAHSHDVSIYRSVIACSVSWAMKEFCVFLLARNSSRRLHWLRMVVACVRQCSNPIWDSQRGLWRRDYFSSGLANYTIFLLAQTALDRYENRCGSAKTDVMKRLFCCHFLYLCSPFHTNSPISHGHAARVHQSP